MNPTTAAAITWQVGLIPYAMEAFRTNNLTVASTIILSTFFYALTNTYYGWSSKRVQKIETPTPA